VGDTVFHGDREVERAAEELGSRAA
jgi:hypothetical protein